MLDYGMGEDAGNVNWKCNCNRKKVTPAINTNLNISNVTTKSLH